MTRRTLAGRSQRGATLIIGLILLVMLTLIVTTAYTMSTTNLKAVGNMQYREEAVAAANDAIAQFISDPSFTAAAASVPVAIDIDKDGSDDYAVTIAVPTCRSVTVASTGSGPTSLALGGLAAVGGTWYTIWDIEAEARSQATGAKVVVHQGVRIILTDSEKDARCP